MQRDPRLNNTLAEIYADGRLVKSKPIQVESYFLSEMPMTSATVGPDWFVFYDSHPGAGDTWYTNYLTIRRRDLRFERLEQFEHGDSSSFQSTRRFAEYKLLKYEGDRRFRRLGVFGYEIVEWRWSTHRARFRRIGHRYAPYLSRHLDRVWRDQPLQGALVGTPTYFQPAFPAKFGLPKDVHFVIDSDYGFGTETVRLVKGQRFYDGLNLMHGETTLAGLAFPIGEPDPHNPPRLDLTADGLILTLTTCEFRQVRETKLLVTAKPYAIHVLGSKLKPAWTPFER